MALRRSRSPAPTVGQKTKKVMELVNLAIVGAAVSVLVQLIKKYAGTNTTATLATVVVVSGLAGWGYFAVRDAAFWPSFVQILSFAGAVYTYLIQRFPDASNAK